MFFLVQIQVPAVSGKGCGLALTCAEDWGLSCLRIDIVGSLARQVQYLVCLYWILVPMYLALVSCLAVSVFSPLFFSSFPFNFM